MNWKNEAIEHLTQYTAMTQALENIPREIKRLERSVGELKGIRTDVPRGSVTPGPKDDALLGNLIKRQLLKDTYAHARVWVDTTERALSALPEEGEMILRRMYILPQKGAVQQLCTELGVEQSSIYRKRDRALHQFTLALYGAT